MNFDVCIIGAGPAGLLAAIEASNAGTKCVVLEKNSTAGRKLLCTGRGRCNVTHEGSAKELALDYGNSGRFLRYSLHEFSPADLCEMFAQNRLAMKVEKGGYVFPLTDRATDVKRVLLDITRRAGAEFIYGKGVQSVINRSGEFIINTGKVQIESKSVIIATGGLSWPETGSTGDGYEFARQFGHDIVEPMAALVPLVTQEKWPSTLQGIGVKDVCISATVDGKKIRSAGPMMFTNSGIGGPAVFDLSRLITRSFVDTDRLFDITIDLLPDTDLQQLDEILLAKCREHPKKEIAWVLVNLVPRGLGISLCEMVDPDHALRTNQLTKEKRMELASLVKALPLTIRSTRPIKEAVITSGGVSTEQIDEKTMQSNLCDGLFFAGEVIDVDGPCGGYNLQIAWSTGALAGKSAAGTGE
jgi:hypothetical protein